MAIYMSVKCYVKLLTHVALSANVRVLAGG